MIKFDYDGTYEPAMPVCQVTISTVMTDRKMALNAIVDTGADATLVPTHVLRHIGARRAFETGLRSQWGERRTVFLYLVDLEINRITLPGVYVVGDESGDEVVLGRNTLNKLIITLDGPQEVVSVEA